MGYRGKLQSSTGIVVETNTVDGVIKKVKFHFPRMQAKFDEWIESDSSRIAPFTLKPEVEKSGNKRIGIGGNKEKKPGVSLPNKELTPAQKSNLSSTSVIRPAASSAAPLTNVPKKSPFVNVSERNEAKNTGKSNERRPGVPLPTEGLSRMQGSTFNSSFTIRPAAGAGAGQTSQKYPPEYAMERKEMPSSYKSLPFAGTQMMPFREVSATNASLIYQGNRPSQVLDADATNTIGTDEGAFRLPKHNGGDVYPVDQVSTNSSIAPLSNFSATKRQFFSS